MISFRRVRFRDGGAASPPRVRPWFSETRRAAEVKADSGGAASLANRNTVILTVLSVIHGLSMYGFLGLYPTFLRETLHYSPINAGKVIGFFGLGALALDPVRLDRRSLFTQASTERIAAFHRRARLSVLPGIADHG